MFSGKNVAAAAKGTREKRRRTAEVYDVCFPSNVISLNYFH